MHNGDKDKEEHMFVSMIPHPHFDRFMKCCRFKEFRHFLSEAFADSELEESDQWWHFASAVDEFNSN